MNVTDSTGRTTLHFACRSGNVDKIRFLLALPEYFDIDYEARTQGGCTPLMFCV